MALFEISFQARLDMAKNRKLNHTYNLVVVLCVSRLLYSVFAHSNLVSRFIVNVQNSAANTELHCFVVAIKGFKLKFLKLM